MTMKTPAPAFLALLVGLGVAASASAADDANTHGGRARVYQDLDGKSLEKVTSATALLAEIQHPNVAPTRLWKLLEHGEKVECLNCIPYVEKLLYSSHPKNREISAWWLRRRVFGVFGPGQAYSRVVDTLNDANQPEERRVYAANALGEFLSPSGVRHVAASAMKDASPRVREASVAALQRLNTEGPGGEVGQALSDDDEGVRLAALKAAISVNVFTSVDRVAEKLGDASPLVRRRAAEALGSMRVSDSVVGLIALASERTEADENVRVAAIWALGRIADPAGRDAVEAALDDSSELVRSSARIARRRL